MHKKNDLIGKRFGKLVVVSQAKTRCTPNGTNVTYWNCLCDCGNVKEIRYGSLINGYALSCGCFRKESVSKHKTKDLTGFVFGYLTVLERNGSTDGKRGKRAIWKCECRCGTVVNVPSNNLCSGCTISCGCIKRSHGEDIVARILNIFDVRFKAEFSFKDLVGKRNQPFRFDYALFLDDNKLACLLEYQGEQHFDNKKGKFGARQRLYSDKIKDEYCKENNIALVKIPYWSDCVSATINAINTFVYHVNPVPSSDDSEKV